MKAIRKLNIFLLIVAIICTIVFVVIQTKEDKYGDYDKNLDVVITDVSVNNSKGTIYFNVTNNGKAKVSYIDLDIRITDSSNQSKYVTQSISCSFYYLESSGSENLEASFYTTNTTSWLIGKTKNSLDLDYKINSVTFSNGNTYTNKNASFESSTQGNNSPENHPHTYSIEKSDQQNHWLECTCGKKNNVENHSGGTATCTEKAKCSVCNQAYGNYAEHTYSIEKSDQQNHWVECFCGKKNNVRNHSGGTATCTEKAKCSVCNQAYGNYAEHTYSTEWVITDTYHYQESTCGCNVKKDYGVHVADADNFCSTCDKVLGATTGIIYDISSDGTYYEVIGYNGTAKRINIADTYQNLPVKNIYNSAFKNNDNITTVIIPDSVTSIGSSAFFYCTSLKSVTIGNNVTSIGNDAFYDCYSLTSVIIPDSITSIGSYAFFNCNSLTSVTIGNSVTSIGSYAFAWCYSLKSVTIGNSVTSIGSYAFNSCNSSLYTIENNLKYVKANNNLYCILVEATNKNLSSYQINSQTKYIADSVFSSCERLTQITIPDSVTSIGNKAFYSCDSLTSVTIGNSVTSIGEDAFYFCSSLTSVTIPDSVTSIGSDAFWYCRSLTSIKYCGSKDQWNSIVKGYGWNSNTGAYTIIYNYAG